MEPVVEWAIHHFQREWAMIIGAPVLSLAAVGLAFLGAWFLLGKLHESRHSSGESAISSKTAHIEFLEGQLAEYKSKLSGASPDQAAKEMSGLRTDLQWARDQIGRLAKFYEHQTSQRSLTAEQANKFTEALNIMNPQQKPLINIGAITDPEAQQYAIELMTAMKAAGICAAQAEPTYMFATTPDERGILVVVQDHNNPPDCAKVIMDAFQAAKIDARLDSISPGYVMLNPCIVMVSHKPLPAEA
jgi:hypothetical protein